MLCSDFRETHTQGVCGRADQYRDAHANPRIGVESATVVRFPDHQCCNYDTDVVDRVSDDVNHHS